VEIEIAGRGIDVDEAIREEIHTRFERVGRQVSDLARLEVVLWEESNPSIKDRCVAEANLRLKGVTLHAEERSPRMSASIKALSRDIARQVKRHRELRRKRSQTRRLIGRFRGREA
jgi:putative sigma-54 modulation protein